MIETKSNKMSSMFWVLLFCILTILVSFPMALAQTTTATNSCGCSTPNEVFINISQEHSTFDLYPTNGKGCENVACLNCTYKIRIQLFFENDDAVLIAYKHDFWHCDAQLILTDCQNNINMLEVINNVGQSRGEAYSFLTQEKELCISFTSRSPSGTCSYDSDGENRCSWHLNFEYMERGSELTFNHMYLEHMTLQPSHPYSVYNFRDLSEKYVGFSISTTDNHSLELWSASVYNRSFFTAVYDAPSLTNYVTTLVPWTNFGSVKSKSNSLTITIPSLFVSEGIYQFFWRIPELHAANCNDTRNFDYAYPYNMTFTKSISAADSGSCMYSIITDEYTFLLPIVHISSLNYVGNGSVKVVSPFGFDPHLFEFELFEFTQASAKYWSGNFVYGELLNFIIPPGGQLNIIFDTEYYRNYTVDETKTFDDYGVGLIQSPAYPTASEGQDLMRLIQCTKGLASYTLEIVLADVPKLGSLRIYGDSRVIRSYGHGRINETVSFNATQVFVEYDAWFEVRTNGILIRYEGIYIGNPGPSTTKANPGPPTTTANPDPPTTKVNSGPPTTTAKAISNAISSTLSQPQHTVSHNSASNFYGVSWTLVLVLLFGVLRPQKFSNSMVVISLWMLMSNCLVQGQDSTSTTSLSTTTANPNCQCYSPSMFYLNSSNNVVTLYPTSTMGDNNYFQVKKPERDNKTQKHQISKPKRKYGVLDSNTTCPCLSCDYKIHTDYYQPGDAVYIDFRVHNVTCQSAVRLTNCKNNLSLLDYLTEWSDGSFTGNLYTQEADICVSFTSNSNNGICDYDYYNGCYWALDLAYANKDDNDLENSLYFENFTLNNTLSISSIKMDYVANLVSVQASTGTLELWAMSFNESEIYLPLYAAGNLTNYTTTLISDKEESKPQVFEFQNGVITMQAPELGILGGNFMMLIRIPEIHAANCLTNNLNMAYPWNTTFSSTIAAASTGSCMFTILVPIWIEEFEYDLPYTLPILHISNISYQGNSSVKASSEFGFIYPPDLPNAVTNFKLFEVNQDSASSFTDTNVFGNLINFIIPPNGVLNLVYTSKTIFSTPLNNDIIFEDRKVGVIQSVNYPFNGNYKQGFTRHIGCSKGLARFNMTIAYADIPPRGYLKILGDDQVVKEFKTSCDGRNVIQNEIISFSASQVLVAYYTPYRQFTHGMLLNYEGNFIAQN